MLYSLFKIRKMVSVWSLQPQPVKNVSNDLTRADFVWLIWRVTTRVDFLCCFRNYFIARWQRWMNAVCMQSWSWSMVEMKLTCLQPVAPTKVSLPFYLRCRHMRKCDRSEYFRSTTVELNNLPCKRNFLKAWTFTRTTRFVVRAITCCSIYQVTL